MAIDSIASAALDAQVIKPVFLAFIDFSNEQMWVNTSGKDMNFSETGDPDIDGKTFLGISGDIIDIGPISNSSSGTNQVKITISGLRQLDADIMSEINDPNSWRSREFRLWRIIRNYQDIQQGGIQHYYTGYMNNVILPTTASSQFIEVYVESYLSAYSSASNRTYLDQEKYDPLDLSARAAIAIANNASGGSPAGNVFSGKELPRFFIGGA